MNTKKLENLWSKAVSSSEFFIDTLILGHPVLFLNTS